MSYFKYILLTRQYLNYKAPKHAKFGIKLGIVAGTIYYVSDKGVWKGSENTIQLYNTMKTNVSPYTEEISKQIPIEIPSLPKTNELSYLTKYYWNRGVLATFGFISKIPTYVSDLTSQGFNAVMDNAEVKNLFVESVDTAEEKKQT